MVNRLKRNPRRRNGMLITEILVSLSILSLTIVPMAYSYLNEQQAARELYQKSVAMELIDGEMEILAAGEWHSFKEGAQSYALTGKASKNLPPGAAKLTVTGMHLRLEWVPKKGLKETIIVREATGK
jgi:type II secretory pathway pseudopilin PulG